jgi:hypothetical protein
MRSSDASERSPTALEENDRDSNREQTGGKGASRYINLFYGSSNMSRHRRIRGGDYL